MFVPPVGNASEPLRKCLVRSGRNTSGAITAARMLGGIFPPFHLI